MAVGFSLLLNLTMIASFIWTEILNPVQLTAAWIVATGVWTLAAGYSWRTAAPRRDASADRWFVRGQEEYLQGKWLEAEHAWREVLRLDSRDVDARLALATLYRHSGRVAEARDELDRLERLEGAPKWRHEVARERSLLDAVQARDAAQHQADSGSATDPLALEAA